jgi:hypothetical protein
VVRTWHAGGPSDKAAVKTGVRRVGFHDQDLRREDDRSGRKVNSSITRADWTGPADAASDCAELARQPRRTATTADGGRVAAFFDDRQRAWRHLLYLRGDLSTALVSARPGGGNVAECADPPSELKCRMEARRVDRETTESVAGVARPLRRAAALVWVRADQKDPRSPAAVLIIFACFGWCRENPGCISACTESEGDDHYGELDN